MHLNAAGIDVGAEFHWVAVPSDRDEQPVQRFGAFTADLYALAEWLRQCQIETVVMESTGVYLSLSRLNHWLPRGQTDSEVMQGTAACHHEIADTVLPQSDPVFDDAAALDAAVDMLNAQAAIVQGLIARCCARVSS